ncbi:MAG TPA: hypothetical protein VFM42_00100 [Sphingomicrobium sp.]|jgi:hypothetical protein|nr:hypothetical protein [Sphingomicrobium sp.]
MRSAIAAALALTAASSVHAQTAAPAPMPDLRFAAPVPGDWSYSGAAGWTEAVFRDAATRRAQLTIRCTRAARLVTISKPSAVAVPFLLVWTTSSSKSFAATFDPARAQVSATVQSSNDILDAMAFSRGRLAVSVEGAPPLVLPSQPEVARVVEDCRG